MCSPSSPARGRGNPGGGTVGRVFEQFDELARQVVVLAQDEARTLKHDYLGSEHILLGLLGERRGVAAGVLDGLDMTLEEVRAQGARLVGQGDEIPTGQIPFTLGAKKVLELALREALAFGHNYIGTEHILLGLVRLDDSVSARILADFDVDVERIRDAVIAAIPERQPPRGVVSPVAPSELASLAVMLEEAKRTLLEGQSFQAAARIRELQRRLALLVQESEAALESLQLPPSARDVAATRWEYDVRPLEGGSDTWVAQLAAWRSDGWELVSVVPEGERRVVILERRV